MSDVVAQAKAALEGVTREPWAVDCHEENDNDCVTVGAGTYLKSPGQYTSTDLIHEVDTYGIELDSVDYARITADAEFIAAARSLVPELVAEIERLRSGLSDMRYALSGMRHTTLCACFVDQASESECDCARGAVMAWIDQVEGREEKP